MSIVPRAGRAPTAPGNDDDAHGDTSVGPVGIEPTTYGLKVRGSTAELEARVRARHTHGCGERLPGPRG